MFGFRKKNAELEELLMRVSANASNNYKDAAQESFKDLKAAFERLSGSSALKEKDCAYYRETIEKWERELQGFTHKDQGKL